MDRCEECGMALGLADEPMLAFWQKETAANCRASITQSEQPGVRVCPACDSYPLGVELELGLPFYSPDIAAFVTVNDWDWWNHDPADCDIRPWPDFGCLTFSRESLVSTITYLRETSSPLLDPKEALPFPSELLGPTGIPEDGNPTDEWKRQLRTLHSRMEGQFTERELDVAVRRLVSILA